MSSNITDILAAYAEAQPRRASGGIHALSGFDYQLRLYLARLATALAESDGALADAGQVFVEALSDIADRSGANLICIQAKRRLTRATLGHAAAEVVAIENFFAAQPLNPCGQVRYELIGASGDGGLTWNNLPAHTMERATIDRLLAAGRLAPPRIEPDPWWQTIAAVWNHLDDPYDFARFALERAMSRGIAPDEARRVRDDICERYAQLRKGNPPVGQALTPADFAPVAAPSPRLDVGREVTLPRIRDRQYMLRPGRRDALHAVLEERHEIGRHELHAAAQVFWISGRSGVGKSVLLAQVIERLVGEGRRVLWLGGAAEKLEPALRALADQPDELRPEFVAIDDLYDRDARTRLDLTSLGAFIDEAGPRPWPVVVTCGPAEFADSFEADARFRGFEVYRQTVLPVAADESARLADWYGQRTGRAPAVGPAFAQAQETEGGLFISLAVELEHGELREFAARFAERIQLSGLDEALRLPLALNRLYLRAPYDWLTEADREKLADLNRDGDFNLLDPGAPGQVVRLTHPHLGDAIYRALRKPGNALAYANDLAHAFRRAVEEGNSLLTGQMLRLFSARREGPAGERLADVDDAALADACANAWLAAVPPLADDAAADIAASWACWAADQPRIALALGKDLHERAVALLNGAAAIWPYAWLRLWGRRMADPPLLDWAARHLPDAKRMRHPSWSFVWERACETDGNEAHCPWRTLGLAWLEQAIHRPDWHFVWKRLLPAPPVPDWDGEPVLDLGMRRLAAGGNGPDWAYVLQDLLTQADGLSARMSDLLSRGWCWLPSREDRADWTHVWQALLAHTGQLPQDIALPNLLALGDAWLSGREDRAEWTHVWQALLAHASQLPQDIALPNLLALGHAWLPGREDRAEWTHVWQALLAHTGQLPQDIALPNLLALGHAWLSGREDRAEWTHVWQALLAHASQLSQDIALPNLLALGHAWLPGREDRAEWVFVWQPLLNNVKHLPWDNAAVDLIAIAWSWLLRHNGHASWPVIWWELSHRSAEDRQSRETLAEEGIAWLRAEGHLGTPEAAGRFVEGLLDQGCTKPDFLPLAAAWLSAASQEKSWPIIAAKFVAGVPEHPASVELAEELARRIDALPNSGAWQKIAPHMKRLDALGDALPATLRELCRAYAERESAPAWTSARRLQESAAPCEGKVVSVKATFCSVELDIGLLALLRHNGGKAFRIGEILSLAISEVNPSNGFVGVILHADAAAAGSIEIGGEYEGTVTGATEFGVFVRIGNRAGLIHSTKLGNVTSFHAAHPDGSRIPVRVLAAKPKGLELEPVERHRPTLPENPPLPSVGDEFDGKVRNVVNFGLFVDIDRHQGLLHCSKLPPHFDFAAVYPRGTPIRVRVCKAEGERISLEPVDSPN